LEDDQLLVGYNVTPSSTLHLIVRGQSSLSRQPTPTNISRDGKYHISQSIPAATGVKYDPQSIPTPASVSRDGKYQSMMASESRIVIPEETTFPESGSSDAKFRAWQSLAEQGDFDVDLEIVDPQAHYARLDELEREVILVSELYRCRGLYNSNDDELSAEWTRESLGVPEWMWASIQEGTNLLVNPPRDEFEEQIHEAQNTLASLRKSYLMLCQVLKSFELLQHAKFSTDFFSFLLRKASRNDTVELVKIEPSAELSTLKSSFEHVITQILETLVIEDQNLLFMALGQPCLRFLSSIGISLDRQIATNLTTLHMLRNTMSFLDLAVVSYVGSHGSRFDLEFMGQEMHEFTICSEFDGLLGFRCSRQRLACLDGFLESRKVWVFEYGPRLRMSSRTQQNADRFLLLTKMNVFADVWGPVSSIPITSKDPSKIKQYNVANGIIHPVGQKQQAAAEQPIRCHWSNWVSFYRRRMTNLFGGESNVWLTSDDNLLIGGGIRENYNCNYKFEDFEEDFEDYTHVLGTSPECWRMDTRSGALSFSKLFGASISGTQKKIPQKSSKQVILDKWSINPRRANPGMLNQYFGLEISHCTGNARRVSLKEIMLMPPVQPFLHRQYPRWRQTIWGQAFVEALMDPNPRSVFDVWNQFHDDREHMANLVCSVLEVLDSTGYANDRFTAAIFKRNEECAVTLNRRADDWCQLLKDSHLMAVFAIINSTCLDYYTPDHSTATCHDHSSPTVLETSIALETQLARSQDRIKLQPWNQILKTVPLDRGLRLWALESSITIPLFNSPVVGTEKRNRSFDRRDGQFHIKAAGVDRFRLDIFTRREEQARLQQANKPVPVPQPLPVFRGNVPMEPLPQIERVPEPTRQGIPNDWTEDDLYDEDHNVQAAIAASIKQVQPSVPSLVEDLGAYSFASDDEEAPVRRRQDIPFRNNEGLRIEGDRATRARLRRQPHLNIR
jgi:hypothetical protein